MDFNQFNSEFKNWMDDTLENFSRDFFSDHNINKEESYMTFADYARKTLSTPNSITEGREKIKVEQILELIEKKMIDHLTITDFHIGLDQNREEYVICIAKELPDKFFFASSVLHKWLNNYIIDVCDGDIQQARFNMGEEGGFPFRLTLNKSNSGRNYYGWTPAV